VLIRHI